MQQWSINPPYDLTTIHCALLAMRLYKTGEGNLWSGTYAVALKELAVIQESLPGSFTLHESNLRNNLKSANIIPEKGILPKGSIGFYSISTKEHPWKKLISWENEEDSTILVTHLPPGKGTRDLLMSTREYDESLSNVLASWMITRTQVVQERGRNKFSYLLGEEQLPQIQILDAIGMKFSTVSRNQTVTLKVENALQFYSFKLDKIQAR